MSKSENDFENKYMNEFLSENQSIIDDIYKLRAKLHTIPELAFEEVETKRTLINYLEQLPGIQVVDRGTWFYASNQMSDHQSDSKAPIAFRADFDAVAGKDGKPGHYCGHDGHASILAGFARFLSQNQGKVNRPVYLIFQPAEEIGKGAVLCRQLLSEKGIKEIYGFHNIPGYALGEILLLDGTFACASTGLEITFTGTPSHAAYPEAGQNPAKAIAELVLYKDELLRQPHEGMILGTVIGIDLGSDAYGVSASQGVLRFTLRAEKEKEFQWIVNAMTTKAMELAKNQQLQCEIRRIEEFPATENHAECLDKLKTAALNMGLHTITPEEPFRWSEDFGYYLQEIPGAFFGVGSGVSHPQLHTECYTFPDDIAKYVLAMYAEIVRS